MFKGLLLFFPVVAVLASCAESTASKPKPKFDVLAMEGTGVFFVVIGKDIRSDKAALRAVANDVCKDHPSFCIVHFWDDKAKAALKTEMTNEQAIAHVAQYGRITATGVDKIDTCVAGYCGP